MFIKLFPIIQKSITDHLGKISSARLSSFIILAQIIVSSIIMIMIDIVNAITLWKQGDVYALPTEHIIIFGMVLTHHLFLLGIKKSSESTPYPSLDNKMALKSDNAAHDEIEEK
jgi:hypothetical protein